MSYEGEPVHSENPCNSGYYFASVIGFGEVAFIENIGEKCEALSIMFKHQTGRDVTFTTGQAQTVCVFKIISIDYTGKQKPHQGDYHGDHASFF
jgi:nitroimidazol reductase NimA-like FMN-containing flavoprotein (pyridoxamine 5'-phosphate oxidase superfamily)